MDITPVRRLPRQSSKSDGGLFGGVSPSPPKVGLKVPERVDESGAKPKRGRPSMKKVIEFNVADEESDESSESEGIIMKRRGKARASIESSEEDEEGSGSASPVTIRKKSRNVDRMNDAGGSGKRRKANRVLEEDEDGFASPAGLLMERTERGSSWRGRNSLSRAVEAEEKDVSSNASDDELERWGLNVGNPAKKNITRFLEKYVRGVESAVNVNSNAVAARLLSKVVSSTSICLYLNVHNRLFTYRAYVDRNGESAEGVMDMDLGHYWLSCKKLSLKDPQGMDAYGFVSVPKNTDLASCFLPYSGREIVSGKTSCNESKLSDFLSEGAAGKKGERCLKEVALFSFGHLGAAELVRYECVECKSTVSGPSGRCSAQHEMGTSAAWLVVLEFVDYNCRDEDSPEKKLACTSWGDLNELFSQLPSAEVVLKLEPSKRRSKAAEILSRLAASLAEKEEKLRIVVYHNGSVTDPKVTLRRVLRR